MADIAPPHIERLGDPDPGTREDPSPQRRVKAAAAGKAASRGIPKIETTEEDQHKLDEMA